MTIKVLRIIAMTSITVTATHFTFEAALPFSQRKAKVPRGTGMKPARASGRFPGLQGEKLSRGLRRAPGSEFGETPAGKCAFERRAPSGREPGPLSRSPGLRGVRGIRFGQERGLSFPGSGGAYGRWSFPRRRLDLALQDPSGFGSSGNTSLRRIV